MILKVLPDTHPRLRKVCHPADPRSIAAKVHSQSLIETMQAHKALGIASNQTDCGYLLRIIAVNIKEFKGAMFNPEILEKGSETISIEEGCLSQKQRTSVPRAKTLKVKFQDKFSKEQILELEGLSAIVVQHEVDHLNGILMSDYETPTK